MVPKAAGDPVGFIPEAPERFDVLSDERRRAVYLYIKRRRDAVTVNEVADRFSIHRNAAKFHLDKLLDAGLLAAEFRRVNGKRGPGAGRPSKLYSATDVEVAFSVPERHYDLLAHLLLQALTSGQDVEEVGRRFGRELATSIAVDQEGAEAVRVVLERLGFEPTVELDDDGCVWITTSNCPFGRVAMDDPSGEVCRLDRAIIGGVIDVHRPGPAEVREHASMRAGADICVREICRGGSPS